MTKFFKNWCDSHSNQTGFVSSFLNYNSFKSAALKCNVEKVLILSAGPSLDPFFDIPISTNLIEDPKTIVVAIKQASLKLKSSPDIFCFNEIRYQKEFDNVGGVRLSVSENSPYRKSHIHFPIFRYKKESSLIYKKNFKFWKYGLLPFRPWGVGIFFELAVHLPILLKAKEVTVAGFDMNKEGPFHFYDDTKNAKSYNVDNWEFELIPEACLEMEKYYLKEKISLKVFTTNPNLKFKNKEIL